MKGLSFITDGLEKCDLTSAEFRVYCRILNKARSGDSQCTESIPTIATKCHLNHKTVRAALALLSRAGMISVEAEDGKPNTISVLPASNWVAAEKITEIRASLTPPKKSGAARNGSTQNERGTPTESSGAPLPKGAGKDTKNTNTLPLPPQKTGKELWDYEFETDFWPIAFKKVSKGAAIKAYRTARKGTDSVPPVSKETIMTAWRLVSGEVFPAKAEEDGSKTYIPMPSTWLNQQKWADEDVVAKLEEANSPEAKAKSVGADIRKEIDRLGLTGLVPEKFRGTPDEMIVSQLDLDSALKYLDWLRLQPNPKQAWEVDYVAA